MNSPEARPPEPAAPSEWTFEALLRSNTELSEAIAARDAFIAVAAHELRNPMTPMIGQIDLLLAGLQAGRYSPEQVEQRLRRVRQAMNHYVKRASALLDVSRITSGKLTLEPTPFDLTELLAETVETFAEAARYAGTPIEMEGPPSLPGTWDRLAMEQIIDNLLSNAIKYGGRRPVHVCTEDFGEMIGIRVRDHGPGIAAADRARIFGRFERAVGPSERRSGFGIGLWVVGQLVTAMSGTITVDDAEGGGSVFAVSLPRHTQAIRA